jgi:hypothetical protein
MQTHQQDGAELSLGGNLTNRPSFCGKQNHVAVSGTISRLFKTHPISKLISRFDQTLFVEA